MSVPHPVLRVALLGSPNSGKSALFNQLTGATQKIANYAGVTVERKSGWLKGSQGTIELIDLPGLYSLEQPRTPDEAITAQFLIGQIGNESPPDRVVVVLDVTHIKRQLKLLAYVQQVHPSVLVALNMMDRTQPYSERIDGPVLARITGCEVVETIAIQPGGAVALGERLLTDAASHRTRVRAAAQTAQSNQDPSLGLGAHAEDAKRVYERWIAALNLDQNVPMTRSERVDAWVLHPILGPIILAAVLFFTFQAVFSWAQPFMHLISAAMAWLGDALTAVLPTGPIQSLLVNGILAGAGTVLLFLPQILILFAFIIILEDSGYLPRAAFLLDRLMSGVGLSGRAFIPLLSSFACAIPGILATRTIPDARDRQITILIAPLMTCSARLPVYALLIGAFIPNTQLTSWGINLQGLVLFLLYTAGIAGAFAVAWLLSRFRRASATQALQMELPSYHWPLWRHLVLGLWQRTQIFVNRVGGTILLLMVVVWFLSSFPSPPPDATRPAIEYSLAGRLGEAVLPIFKPVGFGWQIVVALIPGLAAREVVVGVLGTVYALSGSATEITSSLAPMIAQSWSVPTALALLAWYVYAPQCLSTLAVVRRETASWRMTAFLAGYQFVLAYAAAWATFNLASQWWIAR